MNKKIAFLLTICTLFGSISCSTPIYEDFNDTYVDALPSNSEDGTTFHAFCWTFNQIKENLPYLANAGFKNILTMPVQQPKGGGASWWSFYQPLSFSIADSSSLGTKDELKSLCDEAEKYNISILTDIVANHLANISDDELEEDGTPKVSPSVELYEPIIYRNRNSNVDGTNGVTFHHNPTATGSGAETQFYPYGQLPDLNTSNPYVQQRVLSLLKECIDVGVDGFRFDAAKHIETKDDPAYSSDFWDNTLEVAKKYYKNKTNNELYVYGEILNSPTNRPVSVYTQYMRVTEDGYTSSFKSAVLTKKAEKIALADVNKSTADNLVTWVESHDEYTNSQSHLGDVTVAKMWGILSSRKDLGVIYLGRPDENLTVGKIGSYAFENEYVSCSNRFHNRFVGADEYLSASSEKIFINERIKDNDQGAYVLNLETIDLTKTYEVKLPHLENGNYYDLLTGNKVVVTNNKATMKFDKSGMVFLTRTNQKAHPRFTINEREGLFAQSKSIKITISDYEEAYYTFNDNPTRYELNDETTIELGNGIDKDGNVKLNIHIKNGDFVVNRSFNYSKVNLIDGYFNVFNLNPKYLEDYELFMWSWSPSVWSKNYRIQDEILLIDTSGMTGFLLAIFEKGYDIADLNTWDSNVIKQSADISGKALELGFYDASGF